ncbi:hypothetical protein RB597_003932 [Gaeumannomyces tritici]
MSPRLAGPGRDTPHSITSARLQELVRVIRTTPAIDNHAHPLLRLEHVGSIPLASAVTEASGVALRDTPKTLAHHRAVRQLAAALGCGRDGEPELPASWDAVVAAIERRRADPAIYDRWTAICLAGTETILIDDGLDGLERVHGFSSHDAFVRSPCRRIVRIEAVAADIIERHAQHYDGTLATDDVFCQMLEEFDTHVKQAIQDPDVVGFKSVICYRTGLAIPRVVNIAAARESFADIVQHRSLRGKFTRVDHEGLNELFVHHTAVLIRDCSSHFRKPIQFHTGLGDNDITLTTSSPAHLQDFIRNYPSVPIVLLHASYPYTREAGYLASVYSNVFADIGEVFPQVSQGGQEAILRQILELCPWSKILWSTDGHWLPETYLLAMLQGRQALESVLCDLVCKGQLSWDTATEMTKDILFRNSNELYQLGLSLPQSEAGQDTAGASSDQKRSDLEMVQDFIRSRPVPSFVRLCWLDYTATPRMRMVPFKRFMALLEGGKSTSLGITKAALGLLQNDTLVASASATGEYRLHPDLSSLKSGPISGQVSVYGDFEEQDGSPVDLCPRSELKRVVQVAAQQGLSFLLGFEIEFVLMERCKAANDTSWKAFIVPPATGGHAWSTSRFSGNPQLAQLLRDMVTQLEAIGVEVEQLHAESAPGQFEIPLPPLPPLEAVDTLLHVRETLVALAAAADYRLTLHPKPFAKACGTASHVHVSVHTAAVAGANPNEVDKNIYESFYAGILGHLPAILAFTYSNPASYDRAADGCWAGGRWVGWGTQNRETPLRKIEGSHWELKCLDGLANPYLAMAAVLGCGVAGVRGKEPLIWADCTADPAALGDGPRRRLGMTQMLPSSLEEALKALEADARLAEVLSCQVVGRYSEVKRAELQLLGAMDPETRWDWIVERY